MTKLFTHRYSFKYIIEHVGTIFFIVLLTIVFIVYYLVISSESGNSSLVVIGGLIWFLQIELKYTFLNVGSIQYETEGGDFVVEYGLRGALWKKKIRSEMVQASLGKRSIFSSKPRLLLKMKNSTIPQFEIHVSKYISLSDIERLYNEILKIQESNNYHVNKSPRSENL